MSAKTTKGVNTNRRWHLLVAVVLWLSSGAGLCVASPLADGDIPLLTDTVACDSLVWYDSTYTLSTVATHTFTAADGTDSLTLTLNLTILQSSAATVTQSVCDFYLWPADSVTYYEDSNVVAVLTNSAGCDSVVTLRLTVNHSDTVSSDTVELCSGYSYIWGDTTLLDAGTYRNAGPVPNAVGCDSLWLMTLIVHDTSDETVYDTCAYKDLPYTWGDREYYDSVRNDIFELKSLYGCDSTVHYNLTVVWRCDAFLQFPSVVTPNGDGVNDRFVVTNLVEEGCYPRNRLTVYNRWGWLMYDRENIDDDDDFWSPEGVPEGTYFFRFEGYGFSDKVERRGSFEIIK